MQHHIPVDMHTSESKFERNEEKQMYEYLLMRFYQLNFLDDSNQSNNHQTFQPLAPSIDPCLYSSNVLDLCMQSSIRTALSHQPYKFDDLKDQKHKAKRVILVQALTQNYQSVFLRPSNNDSSIQRIIFATITNQSLISIANCILQYPDLIKDDILNLMNPDLNFLISAIVVYHKINIRHTSSSDLSKQLQENMQNALIEMDLNQDLKRKVLFVLNQYLCQIFTGKKNDYQRFNQQFQSQLQIFKSKYKPSQTRVNQHILLLHHVHQTLLNTQNPQLFNTAQAQSQQFFEDKQPNSLINIFNKFEQQNTTITATNKQSLKSFIEEPYQTSLFVLFQLLQDCGLRTIDNIFTRNPADFRDFTLVSPMAFLLIDPKKINRLNAQSFSLSLWIILDVWIRNSCDQRSPFKQQIHREQAPSNSSQVTESSTKDPRHVYRIKRDAYPNYDSQTIPFRNPHTNVNKKPQNGSSSTDDYLIRLNQTMMIYLLSLSVQTTILKYYPIQNQIFWRLIQIEVVPSLLIHSPFALKTITNQIQKPKTSNVNHQFPTDKELFQRIQAADNLEEIELLQKLLHDRKSSRPQNPKINAKNQTQNSVFESEYNQWVLPWMSLVSTSSLSHIINSPQGPNLVVKLIEKQPNNFMKLYSLESISQIIYFLKNEKLRLEVPSKATQKMYKLKGNKNVKMKKSIDYERKPSTSDPSQAKNKVSCLKGLSEQACKEQLEAVRKILQMHMGKRIDENIIKGALQLFDQLETKIYAK